MQMPLLWRCQFIPSVTQTRPARARVAPTDVTSHELSASSQNVSMVGQASWLRPLVDLEENDDAYLVDVELPGLKKKDVHIETDGRRITVSGERKEQTRGGPLRRHTRSWGQFRYEVVLPDEVDGDRIEAAMNDRVLQLRVPRLRTGQQRRQIEVK
ncbi:MAG: hypothetical protein QOH53_631 [Ilumatobacteraceae bacterium]